MKFGNIKYLKMRRDSFYFKIDKSIVMFLGVLLSLLIPTVSRAQTNYIDPVNNEVFATSDVRMFATIVENDSMVQLQVMGIGPFYAVGFHWALVFDSLQLELLDKDGVTPITDSLIASATILSLDESLLTNPLHFLNEGFLHYSVKQGSYKQLFTVTSQGGANRDTLAVKAGKLQRLYTIFFRKVNKGNPLTPNVFGYQLGNAPQHLGLGVGYTGIVATATMTLANREIPLTMNIPHYNAPELFTYRSPSWVVTDSATNVMYKFADLIGHFSRGDFLPSNSVLRVKSPTETTFDGRLDYDSVTMSGFIYTKDSVDILVDEYTRILSIIRDTDTTDFTFPTPSEITAGKFTRDTLQFYITSDNQVGSPQHVPLTKTIDSLQIGTSYYAWAYIDYYFETSEPFIALGKRIDFITLTVDLDIACANDTVINLPYSMAPNAIVLPEPVIMESGIPVSDSIRNANYEVWNNYPYGLPTNGGFTVKWEVLHKLAGVKDSCEQVVVVNFPPCAENDTVWKVVAGVVLIDSIRTPLIIHDAENNPYSTVRICYECWTAENMQTRKDSLGNDINYAIYKAKMYPDTAINRDKYGHLYDAETATKICPPGWILPSVTNYECLIPYGSNALRQPASWLHDNEATNTTGFSAMPGGYYENNSNRYTQLLGDAYFWTSASAISGVGQVAHIRYICPVLQIEDMRAINRASVRCIKAPSIP